MRLEMESNYASEWLRRHKATLDEFDGLCLDLSGEVGSWLDTRRIAHETLWIESAHGGSVRAAYPDREMVWNYHAVILSKGLVHDAWLGGDPVPLRKYLADVFGSQRLRIDHLHDGETMFTEIRRCGRLLSRSGENGH